jgi:radical SAM superfamily enzyme YgiQ (UPF0313 family)
VKILLIKPPTSPKQFPADDTFMSEPLELEYVAAGVSDKYDVRILDMRMDQALEKHLAEYAPDIVGATSYTPQVYLTRDILKKVKAYNPDILTVVGGHHATLVPQDFCAPDIDIIAIGEGVFTFREIVECVENRRDFTAVKGIALFHDGGLKFTEPREFPDLDSIPFPDRSLTERYRENYFFESSDWLGKPLASFRTSKGCPFRCRFCSNWKVTNGKYYTREPQFILEELKTIKEPYVEFADDETFVDLKRIDKLADLIIDSGIKKGFYSLARSDTVVKNPDVFKKWRKAGLERVFLGAESNRVKDLEYFRKQNTIDNNERAFSILKKIGIKVDASFIIPPDYDVEDFDNLAEYVKSLDAEFMLFMPLTPLPGTDLYNEMEDQLTSTTLELLDMCHMVLPTKLPLDKFYREFAYLYYKVNKSQRGKYNYTHVQKFMKLQRVLKNRHLNHLEEVK